LFKAVGVSEFLLRRIQKSKIIACVAWTYDVL
jgi:hypothetical protein